MYTRNILILIILLRQSAVSAKVEPVGVQPQWPVHRVCAPDLRTHLSVMARPKVRTDNRNANIRAGGTACYLNDGQLRGLAPTTPPLQLRLLFTNKLLRRLNPTFILFVFIKRHNHYLRAHSVPLQHD